MKRRAFAVTTDRRIVWEFINPNQFEEDGVQLVAALFDVVRLDGEYGSIWLARSRKE